MIHPMPVLGLPLYLLFFLISVSSLPLLMFIFLKLSRKLHTVFDWHLIHGCCIPDSACMELVSSLCTSSLCFCFSAPVIDMFSYIENSFLHSCYYTLNTWFNVFILKKNIICCIYYPFSALSQLCFSWMMAPPAGNMLSILFHNTSTNQ